MGGEILELMDERAERIEREARKQGLEKGIEQGVDELSERLSALGVDKSLIEEAIAGMKDRKPEDPS